MIWIFFSERLTVGVDKDLHLNVYEDQGTPIGKTSVLATLFQEHSKRSNAQWMNLIFAPRGHSVVCLNVCLGLLERLSPILSSLQWSI